MGYLISCSCNDNNNTATTVTLTADGTTDIAAGTYVSNISFKPAGIETINIGTTPGGNDIIDGEYLAANNTRDVFINKTFDATTTLYITGITSSTQIKIYSR